MKAKFLALAALVLGLASCQTDTINGVKVDANGEAPVTIQVGLPQEVATRAAGTDSALGAIDNGIDLDNNYDIRYILEVYDANGNLAKEMEKFEDTSIETNFALRLVPGRHYSFVVWADFVKQGEQVALHYDASDLRDVKLTKNMGDNQPMDESRDAYTGVFNTADNGGSVFSSTTAVDIILTRPFAKLRVVTNDMEELYSDLTTATVSYRTPLYTSFNALTATPDEPENNVVKKVDYSTMFYTNEAEPRKNGVQTLFADYFFGAEDGKVHFTLDVADGTGLDIPAVDFNTDIPVQRNYLTTIYGPVLTDANNVTVTIDEKFEGEYNNGWDIDTTDSFLAALQAAYDSDEATIELTDDVVWATGAATGSTPWIPEGAKTKKLTVNAKGHKITATGSGVGAIRMANGGELIINNAVIEDKSVSYAENSWEFGYLEFAGKLQFNECEFVNAIMVEDADATFVGCKFNSNDENQYAVWVSGNNASFKNCVVEGPRGIKMHEAYGSEIEKVVINKCQFNNIYKKPGVAIGDVNADTKVVIMNSTFTNCQAGDQGLYIYETDTDVATFDFTKENNTIVYATDSNDSFNEAIGDGMSYISLGDGVFNAPAGLSNGQADSTLTIVGNGIDKTTVNGATNTNNQNPGNYAHDLDLVLENLTFVTSNNGYNGGFGHAKSVTFRNCKIIGQFYAHSGAPHYFYDCIIDPLTGYLYTYSSNCVFERCTFSASEGKALQIYADAPAGDHTVTITDCEFVAAKQAQTWDGKPVTGIDINSNGAKFTVAINGCTTTGFPAGLNSKSTLWNVKDGGKAHATVTVDGIQVWVAGYDQLANYPNIFTKDGNYYVFSVAGLQDLNNYFKVNRMANSLWNHEYNIAADIDATGFAWDGVYVVVGNNGNNGIVLNGNNHTISNLTINNCLLCGTPCGSNEGVNPGLVKDITMKNVVVNGDTHDAAIFWGNCYTNVNFENVTVDGAKINGGSNVGALVSRTSIDDPNTSIKVNFKNCVVKNSTLEANSTMADPTGASGFIGRAYGNTKLTFENCSVVNNTINNAEGLVGGAVYGYGVWYVDGFKGTGACDTFTNWKGLVVKEVSTVEELNSLNQTNAYVVLCADIDFQGAAMTKPIELWGNSTFDGMGHKISNVTTAVQGGYATSLFRGDANSGNKVVKNLVIENITTPVGYNYAAAVWSDLQGANIEIDNVHINGATIAANGTIGGFVGFVSAGTTSVVIKNSSINNSNLNGGEADHKRGAVVGRAYGCAVACENVVVDNVKINDVAATATTLVGDKGYTGTVTVK